MIAKKFNISKEIYNKITNDMIAFGYNSFGDKNDFFTKVIINTHRFNDKINKIKQLENILLDVDNVMGDNEIINTIRNISNIPNFKQQLNELAILLSNSTYSVVARSLKSKNREQIFIRGTKSTDKELTNIINETANLTAADVFKSLVYDYANYPVYIREKIMHSELFDKLEKYKNKRILCNIETQNGKYKYTFKIHSIVIGNEEKHYYVVGINVSNNKIMNFKLTTISNVYSLNTSYEFNELELEGIDNKLKYAPEWINDEIITCRIQFDDEGIKRYNVLSVNRPNATIDEETKIMEVTCSQSQLLNYLRPFGNHAVIIDDIKIKKSLLTFYKNGYEAYSK